MMFGGIQGVSRRMGCTSSYPRSALRWFQRFYCARTLSTGTGKPVIMCHRYAQVQVQV
jgi:hypothetical protein